MDGRLREAYHELLIDIHLGPHANTREHTQGEFIIPLTNKTKRIQLYDDPARVSISEGFPRGLSKLNQSFSK